MSDSVGKISLDLEVRSDINKQLSNVSSMIGKNIKKSLDSSMKNSLKNIEKNTKGSLNNMTSNVNNSLKSSMGKIKNTIKSIFSNMKNFKMPEVSFPKPTNVEIPRTRDTYSTVNKRGPPTDIEQLKDIKLGRIQTLDITDRQIDNLRNKLGVLNEKLKTTFNKSERNKLEGTILATEARIDSLINKSIKLGAEIKNLDSKINSIGNRSNLAGNKVSLFNNSLSRGSKESKKLSNSIKDVSKSTDAYRMSLANTMGQMFKWMIILPTIASGIKAMAVGLYNNLMTNEQFANSLAQIKSNLMIAFTPIYEAVLPAINALMSALSVATQYIASFISAIFGKTYNQSKQATQGLIDAKAAMGVYGESAKKTGKEVKEALGLASFDEINTLNTPNNNINDGDVGGGGVDVPTLVTPALDTTSVDSAMKELVDRIKAYINTFNFEPLIQSFNRLKKSVEPIINNLGKIIKWFLVEILDPLAHWTISDLLPAFLNLLAGVLDILNPILEVFMSLGKWLWEKFLQPIAAWTGGIIVDVLNGLADILSNIGKWISEHKPFVEDFVLVLGSFALAWGIVRLALNGLWLAAVAWNAVSGIGAVVTTAFGAAIAFLTSPIGIAIVAIGSLIAIGVLLYKHWDAVKAKAIEVWNKIKETISEFCENAKAKLNEFKEKVNEIWNKIKSKFNEFKEWLGNVFSTDWSQKFGFFGDILNGFLKNIKNIWDSIKRVFQGIIDFIAGVFTGNWERAWQGVVNIFGGIMDGLGAVIKGPLNAVISLINAAISGLNKISVDIPSWVPGFGGKTFGINIPKIPYLAKGGILDKPTLAMVGEAGKEAVVPLENNTQGLDLLANKLFERMPQGRSFDNSMSGDLILMIDSSVIGKVALKELRKMQRQGGITLIPT